MGTITAPRNVLQATVYDAYPSHWGAALTVAVVGSRIRQAERGWRRSYVDLLSELVKADGHTSGVLRKLFTAVANKPWNIVAAQADGDTEVIQAQIIADDCRRMVATIPRWKQNVAGMLWGWFYGATGREVDWKLTAAGYRVERMKLIHSRRIQYDNRANPWRPYVTSGGTMTGTIVDSSSPANAWSDYMASGVSSDIVYVDDWPGRIMLFEPALDDDYQPRQGLGQVTSWWMGFKKFGARDMLAFIERYGKPCPIVTVKTGRTEADEKDIPIFEDVVQKLGRGTQPGAVIPDTGALNLVGPGGSALGSGGSGESTPHKYLIELCNSEISKAIVTATLTADAGPRGNRSLGDRQGDDQDEVIAALASQWDDCVTNELVRHWALASYGPEFEHLFPTYHTCIKSDTDLVKTAQMLDVARNKLGMKIPAAWAHSTLAVPRPAEDEEVLGDDDPGEETETADTAPPAGDKPEQETGDDTVNEET